MRESYYSEPEDDIDADDEEVRDKHIFTRFNASYLSL